MRIYCVAVAVAGARLGHWLLVVGSLAVVTGWQVQAANVGDAEAMAAGPQIKVLPPKVRVEVRQIEAPDASVGGDEEPRREPYLGVGVAPVSELARVQLELPEGIGLAVNAVAKDGPAGRSGVKEFDILKKIDDQLICTPKQLQTLVKAAGPGRTVTLTLVRAGKEEKIDVVIDEREVVVEGKAASFMEPLAVSPGISLSLGGLLGDNLAEVIPGLGEDVRQQVQQQVQKAIERAQAGTFGDGGGAQVLAVNPEAVPQHVVVVVDQQGSVEVQEAGGKRTITVKTPTGKPVYHGLLDNDADREKVPEPFRELLGEAEKQFANTPQSNATEVAEELHGNDR